MGGGGCPVSERGLSSFEAGASGQDVEACVCGFFFFSLEGGVLYMVCLIFTLL